MRFIGMLCLVALCSCKSFQAPKPQPGPIACLGARGAQQAWNTLDEWMRWQLALQQELACAEPVPTMVPLARPVCPAP